MKRFIAVFLTMALLAPGALAQDEHSDVIQNAVGCLTEIYGYTQAEADAFAYTVTENDVMWHVVFAPEDHPEWAYSADYDKASGKYVNSVTPFSVPGFAAYPGEASVRDGLRAARENGWFTDWSEENRAAFSEWMSRWRVQPGSELNRALADEDATAAQLIQAYFISCYGDPLTWPAALTQWRDEELAAYGLTAEEPAQDTEGYRRYSAPLLKSKITLEVTEFSDEIPEELAISHPKLQGWTCVCGAYCEAQTAEDTGRVKGSGLLAFEKDGTRVLVMILRPTENDAWTVAPVGEKALLQGRDLHIVYDSERGTFGIEYPISDTESECFDVKVRYNDQEKTALCQLVSYTRADTATGEGITIDDDGGRMEAFTYWYHVTTYSAGGATKEELEAATIPPYLEYIDAEAFPKTPEECSADAGYALPEGYAVTCGVHLRAKTSSRSGDLGTYKEGTLAQVMGEEPGDPYNWYHVRIGSREGYMSGVYVDYPGSQCSMQPLSQYMPLPVAKARKDISLKKGTGWFDGKVATLPAGTKMHVMASSGNWLHVMVPREGEPGWLMDTQGTDGYVKAGDVLQAATSLQLDWLEP